MKTAYYYNNSDIRIKDIPIPRIKSGEILVKVMASGICGTDVMEWYRIKTAPRVLGHEIAGIITASRSNKYKVGQRVFVSHHVPCDKCKYCRSKNHTACETLHKGNYYPGGYSEYIRVPKINVEKGVYILPKKISYKEATLIEPLACAIRAQETINIKKNQIVLILGSGMSGLLNIKLAKLKGAHVIATDINKYRLKEAREFGSDLALDAKKKLPNIKADKIILCTGSMNAAYQAFDLIDRKGTILFFAIPAKNIDIPIVDIWRNEITITSSYGAAPKDLKKSIDLIEKRVIGVKSTITHTLSLEQIKKGFSIVEKAKKSLKVVLIP